MRSTSVFSPYSYHRALVPYLKRPTKHYLLSTFYNSQSALPMHLCEPSKLISGKPCTCHRRSQTHFVELFYTCHSSLPPQSHITYLKHLPNDLSTLLRYQKKLVLCTSNAFPIHFTGRSLHISVCTN